ncbi:hypothetical protein ACSLO9_34410, partial [Escherichia coli]
TQISGKFGFRCVNRGFLCFQYHISTTLNDNMLNANGEDGVILGAVYSDVDKPPFSDKNIRGTRFADG